MDCRFCCFAAAGKENTLIVINYLKQEAAKIDRCLLNAAYIL
jgi:hypothetical protein